MATVSFTRKMKLNEKESKELLKVIDSSEKVDYKVKTSPAKKATKKTLDKVFG